MFYLNLLPGGTEAGNKGRAGKPVGIQGSDGSQGSGVNLSKVGGKAEGKTEKPTIVKDAQKVRWNRWKKGRGRDTVYIEKDKFHEDEYEVYDRFGRHKGSVDGSGRPIKSAKPGRTINK